MPVIDAHCHMDDNSILKSILECGWRAICKKIPSDLIKRYELGANYDCAFVLYVCETTLTLCKFLRGATQGCVHSLVDRVQADTLFAQERILLGKSLMIVEGVEDGRRNYRQLH